MIDIRNVHKTFGGFPALSDVSLRIKDAKAKEMRTISRTFKILAAS